MMFISLGQVQLLKKGNRRGFTLIEMMYAMALFAIGLNSLLVIEGVAIVGVRKSYNINMASLIGSNTLEKIRSQNPQSILSQNQPIVTTYDRYGTAGAQPVFFTVNTTVTNQANVNHIVVQVLWMDLPNNHLQHSLSLNYDVSL